MRKNIKVPFKQLVLENKIELLKSDKEIEKIEKKLDEKYVKSAK
jgi:hypothetical protein